MNEGKKESVNLELKDPGRYLWEYLSENPVPGITLKKNESIGHYTVDLVCLKNKIIIEADSSQHLLSDDDVSRDYWLESQGYSVLRFSGKEIFNSIDSVIKKIKECLDTRESYLD